MTSRMSCSIIFPGMGVWMTRPVAPWVFLLALSEDWSDTGFPPVLRQFSCHPGPLKDDGEWLSNDIGQLLQQSRVHPLGAHGFAGVQFA